MKNNTTMNLTQPLLSCEEEEIEPSSKIDFAILSFQIKEAEVCNWIMSNEDKNPFAQSLFSYLKNKGVLTPRQIQAVKNSIEEIRQIQEEKNHARRIESERKIRQAQEEKQRRARALEAAREKEEAARLEADEDRRRKELAEWRANQEEIKKERLRKEKQWEERQEQLRLEREKERQEWEEKEKERKEPITSRAIENVYNAFLIAKGNKKGRLRLKIGALAFQTRNLYYSPDSDEIVVKHNGNYIGVINEDAEFLQGRNVPEEALAALVFMKSDLRKATTDHGKKTGNCACCGRELTDPKSIEMGIGPLCAERWGFNL